MKYEGLRKLEVTVRESSSVVCRTENETVENQADITSNADIISNSDICVDATEGKAAETEVCPQVVVAARAENASVAPVKEKENVSSAPEEKVWKKIFSFFSKFVRRKENRAEDVSGGAASAALNNVPSAKKDEKETAQTVAEKAEEGIIRAQEKKPEKRRKLLPVIVKQVVISAIVVGGLLLLKFIDSGFSAEVFKGVKDIVSYNFEVTDVFT